MITVFLSLGVTKHVIADAMNLSCQVAGGEQQAYRCGVFLTARFSLVTMEAIMAIAPTLQKYLDQSVTYDVIPHEPTMTSIHTAEVCHISGDRLAKGIVLCRDGGYLLAVLPASHHIQLPELRTQLGEDVGLATEEEITQLFADCARGAVPAIGTCYALDAIIDESMNEQPDVYIEGGDHATLIHMGQSQFARLTMQAQRGRFSVRI